MAKTLSHRDPPTKFSVDTILALPPDGILHWLPSGSQLDDHGTPICRTLFRTPQPSTPSSSHHPRPFSPPYHLHSLNPQPPNTASISIPPPFPLSTTLSIFSVEEVKCRRRGMQRAAAKAETRGARRWARPERGKRQWPRLLRSCGAETGHCTRHYYWCCELL